MPRPGHSNPGSCTWTATTASWPWAPTRPSRCRARTRSAARRPSRPDPHHPRTRSVPMSEIEIRDDRAAGRLEATGDGTDGEVVGHIEYFVLESPARALVPVHTIVEPAHEGKGIAGSLARELYAIAEREGIV